MRKFLSLEDDAVVADQQTLLETSNTATDSVTADAEIALSETEASIREVQSDTDSLDEADSTLQTTETIEQTVERSVEENKGLDTPQAEILEAAMEHFYDRYGYAPATKVVVSMENIADANKRLEETKIALEAIKDFNTKLRGKLRVAMEGLFSRLGNTLKLIFTSKKKILASLSTNSASLADKGSVDKVIDEPGWGRSFAIINKQTIEPSDVIKLAQKYETALTSASLLKILEDNVKLIDEVTKNLSKANYWRDNSEIESKIMGMSKEADAMNKKHADILSSEMPKTAKTDPSFKPLSKEDGKKLSAIAISIMTKDSSKLEKATNDVSESIEAFYRAGDHLQSDQYVNSTLTVAESLLMRGSKCLDPIWDLIMERDRFCFAVSRYIKASTQK